MARFQGFTFDDWPTGAFATMTVAGSRPGGAVASAWAVLNYLGYDGYLDRVGEILDIRRRLAVKVNHIAGVHVLGRPAAGIVAIGGDGGFDMAAVRDAMAAKGWQFGPLVDPPGLNLLLNRHHGAIIEPFAADLADTAAAARAGKLASGATHASYGS